MATSTFFNNFASSSEQNLIEDLITESIKIYGMDMYYIKKVATEMDYLTLEDDRVVYKQPLMIEMYIKNVFGFGGDGDFLSKFNIQIRDTMTFTVSRKSFGNIITSIDSVLSRPREGDLIYFPLNKKIFEIKFVEHESIFYQMGALQTYDLKCELFEYSNEIFDTGIDYLDGLAAPFSNDSNSDSIIVNDNYYLSDTNGYMIMQSVDNYNQQATENDDIQLESDNFVDWSDSNPFSES